MLPCLTIDGQRAILGSVTFMTISPRFFGRLHEEFSGGNTGMSEQGDVSPR